MLTGRPRVGTDAIVGPAGRHAGFTGGTEGLEGGVLGAVELVPCEDVPS